MRLMTTTGEPSSIASCCMSSFWPVRQFRSLKSMGISHTISTDLIWASMRLAIAVRQENHQVPSSLPFFSGIACAMSSIVLS